VLAAKAEAAAAGAPGELPLDYMIRIMRDPTTEPHRRDAMAKAAAGRAQSWLPLHGVPCGGVVTVGSSITQSLPPHGTAIATPMPATSAKAAKIAIRFMGPLPPRCGR
jgi:hypothetical protein